MNKAINAAALVGVVVVMMLSFTAGRSCERRNFKDVPAVVDTVTVAVFTDRYLEAPSGPRPAPERITRTDTVLDIRLAGCDTAATGGTESLLAVTRDAGKVRVARMTDEGKGEMTEYRIPERGNKLFVGAEEGVPVVVGDRWWWLRDVEVVGFAHEEGAMAGLKVPVSTSLSLMGGYGTDVWIGASWRPFVNWP